MVRDLDAVRELKEGEGGPIGVHGSATLARALHEAGLVDAADKQKLTLSGARTYANGVQLTVFDTVPVSVDA